MGDENSSRSSEFAAQFCSVVSAKLIQVRVGIQVQCCIATCNHIKKGTVPKEQIEYYAKNENEE